MTPESAAASIAAARAANWYALTWNTPQAVLTPRPTIARGLPDLSAPTVALLRLIAGRTETDQIDAREAGLAMTRDKLADAFRRLHRRQYVEKQPHRGNRGHQRTTLWRITDAGRAYLRGVGE
jgi:DNA-binding MarR family transcriptional regulator